MATGVQNSAGVGMSLTSNQLPSVEEKKDSYFGATFDSHNQENVLETLDQKPLVAILFSAYWCPPCHTFLPLLQEIYKEVNFDSPQFEIFFASFDQSEE